MDELMEKHLTVLAGALCLLLAAAPAAEAYIGPGPGLAMLGSFFALIGGVAVALFLVLLYPIRLLLKRRKQRQQK